MLGLGLCHLDAHKCNACDHRFWNPLHKMWIVVQGKWHYRKPSYVCGVRTLFGHRRSHPTDFLFSSCLLLSNAIRVRGLQMRSGRPMVMGTQPEPSILGFHHRRLQESGVYILGFGTRRFFSLALAAARRCCVLTNFFLVDNQSLSLQSLVCAFY